jgi:deoxyribodipyrimidine photo-lyase
MWRDFFTFWCMHNGKSVFEEYGIHGEHYRKDGGWKTDINLVKRWREGRTGMPLIDALMRELNATGIMTNRGRLLVASYLTMDMKQDWRMGAMYFEEKLLDHDVCSNYGGWNFAAGLGPSRAYSFNILS